MRVIHNKQTYGCTLGYLSVIGENLEIIIVIANIRPKY